MLRRIIVKTLKKVVNSCPIPVIIAGGPKLEERAALELAYSAVKAGAAGVDMGRNIWQSKYPVPMIRAVRAIVHGNVNVNEAYDLFKRLCKESPSKNNKPKPQTQSPSKPKKPSKNQKKK